MKKTILLMFGVLFSLFANAQFKATKKCLLVPMVKLK